jgi:hypothetical protein
MTHKLTSSGRHTLQPWLPFLRDRPSASYPTHCPIAISPHQQHFPSLTEANENKASQVYNSAMPLVFFLSDYPMGFFVVPIKSMNGQLGSGWIFFIAIGKSSIQIIAILLFC